MLNHRRRACVGNRGLDPCRYAEAYNFQRDRSKQKRLVVTDSMRSVDTCAFDVRRVTSIDVGAV